MITTILGLLSSPLLGSVVGFFSSWLMKKEARKDKELDYQHELAISKLNHAQKIELTKTEGELAVQKQDAISFTESIKSERIQSGNKILDGLKALIRPVITVYLLCALTYICITITAVIGGINALPVSTLVILYQEIIHQILFLSTAAVSFWFGLRPTHKEKR